MLNKSIKIQYLRDLWLNFLSVKDSQRHMIFFSLSLMNFHFYKTEQAALLTLLSAILPKENVPPPSVSPPVAPHTFPLVRKILIYI